MYVAVLVASRQQKTAAKEKKKNAKSMGYVERYVNPKFEIYPKTALRD